MFDRFRFLQFRVAKSTENKNAMQSYKDESDSREERTGNARKLKGIPKSLVIWVSPSNTVCLFVLISLTQGSQIDCRGKGKADL